jgi:hypothetical protein
VTTVLVVDDEPQILRTPAHQPHRPAHGRRGPAQDNPAESDNKINIYARTRLDDIVIRRA